MNKSPFDFWLYYRGRILNVVSAQMENNTGYTKFIRGK